MSFTYLLQKIRDAEFEKIPFHHLHIRNFFTEQHFNWIVSDEQIKRPRAANTRLLIDDLIEAGYVVQPFAGSIESIDDYLQFLQDRNNFDRKLLKGQGTKILSGYGMTMRLDRVKSTLLSDLREFLNSDEFVSCLLEKFSVERKIRVETAYQKNLTGYNLSPHPDMRDKALTYMANIYTEHDSPLQNFHTHFLEFNDEYKYIYDFWKYNKGYETCWVPWSWCKTRKITSENNAISIFAPSFDTLHAVDIEYDHLRQQRNQIYGNLWYEDVPDVVDSGHTIVDLVHHHKNAPLSSSPMSRFKSGVVRSLKMLKLINR